MATGKINVQTENIFPIIKKFLYSDHEIFLRELVANATDATQKLKTLGSIGEFKGEVGEATIRVSVDKDAKTITVSDRGLGMTGEEIEKYITQIAFSGAEEFVNKYKDKAQGIIGHFGLGFYSAFMVSSKVEIISKSFKDAPAVKWECDGSPEYTLTETEKTDRGTDIILHIAEDSEEFLEEGRIRGVLTKYCKFLPVEIAFGKTIDRVKDEAGVEIEVEKDAIINNTQPAWVKTPASLTDEDYKDFYRELYPYAEEPLFHIHLNVDYPFNLTGILYFPKLKNNVEVQKNKIQLYCNQVFVTDSVEGIVPDFLTLLHGVIDSPDIPLNVSRSYLQSDGNVKKIASHITKKVADKLEEMFKNDRADFEKKWDDIKVFIQYGMLTEEKFFERATKFALYKNVDSVYSTFEDYKEKIKPIQTDKDEQLIILYTNDKKGQHTYIETAKQRGYDVLEFEGPLAAHYISKIETTTEKCSFARVDSDTIDKIIKKTEDLPSKLTNDEQEAIKPVFEKELDTKKFHISFESMSETDQPAVVTQTEFMRRMKEQQAMGGGGFYGALPEMYNVVINANHPIIAKIKDSSDVVMKEQMAKQVVDLALLTQGMLTGEDLTKFVKRSVELIGKE